MALTVKPQASKVIRLEVLRPICMQGERVEVGAVVEVDSRVLATELMNAGKVRIAPEPEPEKPAGAKA